MNCVLLLFETVMVPGTRGYFFFVQILTVIDESAQYRMSLQGVPNMSLALQCWRGMRCAGRGGGLTPCLKRDDR